MELHGRRWRPVHCHSPLAAEYGRVDLTGLRLPAGCVEDCLRASSPRRQARRSLCLTDQLPAALSYLAQHDEIRSRRLVFQLGHGMGPLLPCSTAFRFALTHSSSESRRPMCWLVCQRAVVKTENILWSDLSD